jgi:hypothetical protein
MKFSKIWNNIFYVIAVVALVLFLLKPTRKELCLEDYDDLKNQNHIGVVYNKYIDKEQHYSKVLKIQNSGDTNIWVLTYDKSGLYDYLELNDSIFKASGSHRVRVFRKNSPDTTFILDYGCDDL